MTWTSPGPGVTQREPTRQPPPLLHRGYTFPAKTPLEGVQHRERKEQKAREEAYLRLHLVYYKRCSVFLSSCIPVMLLAYSFLPGIDWQQCVLPLPGCFPVPPRILWGVTIPNINTGGEPIPRLLGPCT